MNNFNEKGRMVGTIISEQGRHRILLLDETAFHILGSIPVTRSVSVIDTITVSETISAIRSIIDSSVVDSIAISDDIVIYLSVLDQSVIDSITVGDVTTISLATLNESVIDSVTVGDTATTHLSVLNIATVVDGLLVTEAASVIDLVVEVGVVVDSAHVDEFAYPVLDVLNKSIVDSITLSDASNQELDVFNIQPYEDLLVGEDWASEMKVGLQVEDFVTVSEDAVYEAVLIPSGSDDISVSEVLTMFQFSPPIRHQYLEPSRRIIQREPRRVDVQLKPIRRQVVLYPREGVHVS